MLEDIVLKLNYPSLRGRDKVFCETDRIGKYSPQDIACLPDYSHDSSSKGAGQPHKSLKNELQYLEANGFRKILYARKRRFKDRFHLVVDGFKTCKISNRNRLPCLR